MRLPKLYSFGAKETPGPPGLAVSKAVASPVGPIVSLREGLIAATRFARILPEAFASVLLALNPTGDSQITADTASALWTAVSRQDGSRVFNCFRLAGFRFCPCFHFCCSCVGSLSHCYPLKETR